MVDKHKLKFCSAEIRRKMTLREWAAASGFKYKTVIQFLNGHCCKRQIGVGGDIVARLRADGYLDGVV